MQDSYKTKSKNTGLETRHYRKNIFRTSRN